MVEWCLGEVNLAAEETKVANLQRPRALSGKWMGEEESRDRSVWIGKARKQKISGA